jgi:hypothetical protein
MATKMLTRQDVAELLDVKINTIDHWRRRPAVNFPDPDGYIGATPWWKPSTIAKFRRNRNQSGYWGHQAVQGAGVTEAEEG